ncbi:hypothetical protein [Pseudoalteromonas gelatinilytica]
MISTNKRWQESIAQAMDETQNNQRNKNRASIVLPSWLPYAAYIAFGFLLAKTLLIGHETHPVNYDRDYQTGSSVALLMIAEDVEHYRTTYGELPDDLPSPIASVMDVTYEKITNEHFRLTIPHGDSTITFDAKDDKIYME